jgi:hypothetical protein
MSKYEDARKAVIAVLERSVPGVRGIAASALATQITDAIQFEGLLQSDEPLDDSYNCGDCDCDLCV